MEKLKNIVKLLTQLGLVHFIIILDNNGKRIYSKYYVDEDNELFDISAQKEFETKMAQSVLNLNVNKNNESIF
jgi:hypothetical protein